MTTALVDWLWQGVALVAMVSLGLSRARRISASMRCRVWWATLGLVIALPLLGLLELPGVGAILGAGATAELPGTVSSPGAAAEDATWIVFLPYLGFVAWMSWAGVRFYTALVHLDAAKRACRPFPVRRERALPRWKSIRNRGRRATLVVSEHVRAAGVLGLGYPRIAVAPELLSSLGDEELDQLVLHEYAHVQRRDDVASAIQCFAKTVIGWHPAVWWIDRRLRIEREVACDDWVLAATGAPRTYARCLARIADLTAGSESSLLPAATRQKQLTTRVLRLLDGRRNISTRPSGPAVAAATLVLGVVSVGLAGRHTSVITLPSVARASVAPGVDTPELTLASLLRALHEPTARRATRFAESVDAGHVHADDPPNVDAVRAVASDAVLVTADVTEFVAAQSEPRAEPDARAKSDVLRVAPSVMAEANPVAPAMAPASTSEPSAEAEDSDSWVDSTRRALAGAGKTTGQSIAEAGVSTGVAVADASVAAARGTQKSAVKAGRFFSRLGRTLAKPF